VVKASWEVKDAKWIFDLHVKAILEQLAGRPEEDFLGLIIDNTKANRNALSLLQKRFPRAILLGCADHGLDLVLKVGRCSLWGICFAYLYLQVSSAFCHGAFMINLFLICTFARALADQLWYQE
jgi:hypothetical protein